MKTTEEQKLEFLDDILKYLANEKSENVVLQNIVTNVGYDKLNSSVFTIFIQGSSLSDSIL